MLALHHNVMIARRMALDRICFRGNVFKLQAMTVKSICIWSRCDAWRRFIWRSLRSGIEFPLLFRPEAMRLLALIFGGQGCSWAQLLTFLEQFREHSFKWIKLR